MLSARLRAGNERYALQRMALGGRLARAMLQLAHSCGEELPDRRILIRQKVSQAELGNMIGAARENVNRQLAEWRRHRLLSRISGYYCLEDPAALEPLARGSPLLPYALVATAARFARKRPNCDAHHLAGAIDAAVAPQTGRSRCSPKHKNAVKGADTAQHLAARARLAACCAATLRHSSSRDGCRRIARARQPEGLTMCGS